MIKTTSQGYPRISVIIPTHNRRDMLVNCLRSLGTQDYPEDRYEIIVVDDASDEDYDLPCSVGRRVPVRYIRRERNAGSGAARNTGLEAARGEVIAFIDDDCSVETDWLLRIVEAFKRCPEASAVGGSIENAVQTPLAWAAYILEFSSWFPSGKIRLVKDIPSCNVAYRKNDISTCRFAVNKYRKYEDSLFNHELTVRGKRIVFSPRIKVLHHKGLDHFTYATYLSDQERYARAFLDGGFKVHGFWGRFLVRFRVLNLLCPRLALVFWRCLTAPRFLSKFLRHFHLIYWGEFSRNLFIFRSQGTDHFYTQGRLQRPRKRLRKNASSPMTGTHAHI